MLRVTLAPPRHLATRCCASARPAYKLTVAYDGTAYLGFQLQPNERTSTVQKELEGALCKLLHEPRELLGLAAAARTDAGVHAAGQVVSFSAAEPFASGPERLLFGLNSLLPDDIRVVVCSPASPGFSARFRAVGKRYVYSLDAAPIADPLRRRHAAHVWQALDLEAMRLAASHFLGTHDFSAFGNVATVERTPHRTVSRCDLVSGVEPRHLRVVVEGSGFLYRQVRNMVGALLLVGKGAHPSATREALESGLRMPHLAAAPAHGLCLDRVWYADEPDAPPELVSLALLADNDMLRVREPSPCPSEFSESLF